MRNLGFLAIRLAREPGAAVRRPSSVWMQGTAELVSRQDIRGKALTNGQLLFRGSFADSNGAHLVSDHLARDRGH